VVEVSPGAWQSGAFDLADRNLAAGIVPAEPVLHDSFPADVRRCWRELASFNLASHTSGRSLGLGTRRVSRKVAGFVRDLRPDVLHVDDPDVTPRLALAAGDLPPVPTVLSVYDPLPHLGERNWRKELSRRLLFPRAQRFVVHHEHGRSEFCRRYRLAPEDVAVVRQGAFELLRAYWSPGMEPDPATVLFVGRLSPYKGLDVLFEAAPLVAEGLPDVHVVVAGRPIPGYRPPPVPDLPGGATVEVRERYLPNQELAQLVQRAGVVVCPYIDASDSGVLLTALGLGRPVVVSSAGGLAEYVEDGVTGLVVPPGDVAALATAVLRVTRDAELRGRLEERVAAARAGPLSWRRVADELLGTYVACMGAERGARGAERPAS
jgi:glycosyltransferase involved in cell wall biosynthesis